MIMVSRVFENGSLKRAGYLSGTASESTYEVHPHRRLDAVRRGDPRAIY